jgi:hypothetical protein
MYVLYDFVCYDLFHILLSCDKIMDPWNVYMYVCMYMYVWAMLLFPVYAFVMCTVKNLTLQSCKSICGTLYQARSAQDP